MMIRPIFQPRKRFGQHFLQDTSVIQKIITAIAPKKTDQIVEIGPGLGALTKGLLKTINRLQVIELDRSLIPALTARCANLGELTVYQADALKFNFNTLGSNPLRLVGNLPYNISTPLLFHLLAQASLIQDMHFMLQKELVDRLIAQPGDPAYGRLSIMVQYHCQVKNLLTVKPSAFYPVPKVNSAVLRLVPYPTLPDPAHNPALFAKIVRVAFSQRRKTLRNSLRTAFDLNALASLAIDLQKRPEQLALADYVKIANALDRIA